MAVYKCTICGEIYDEDDEPVKFADLPDDWVCPLCGSPKSAFVKVGEESEAPVPAKPSSEPEPAAEPSKPVEVDILPAMVRHDGGVMDDIHAMAEKGKSISGAMDTQMDLPKFDDILILGAQLDPAPLDDDAEVSIRTVIGKKAKKPMVLETPIFVSHMSFGALSGRAK
ncbi:MAG: rubredoxin, partial [Candidatus Methanomethylophilaceae archaeon]|nr:rubredoxin [Candidatus Methanomethylophilaceae archaeon]